MREFWVYEAKQVLPNNRFHSVMDREQLSDARCEDTFSTHVEPHLIHVIERSALTALEAKLAVAVEALKIIEHDSKYFVSTAIGKMKDPMWVARDALEKLK